METPFVDGLRMTEKPRSSDFLADEKYLFYTHKTLAIKFCAYIIELMEGNNANQPHLGESGVGETK